MREIRTLRATWRGLETWNGREYHGRPARQSSTLPEGGEAGAFPTPIVG
jgi:hypothetical protein